MQWTPFSSHSIWFICRSWPWCRPHHLRKLPFPSLIPLMSFSPASRTSDSSFLLFIKPSPFYFSKMIFTICLHLLKTKLVNTNLSPTLSSWANEISSHLLNICMWMSHRYTDTNSLKSVSDLTPQTWRVSFSRFCESSLVSQLKSSKQTIGVGLWATLFRLSLPSAQSQGWQTQVSGLCPTPGENHLSTELPQLLTASASTLCPSHISSSVLTGWPF